MKASNIEGMIRLKELFVEMRGIRQARKARRVSSGFPCRGPGEYLLLLP